ncbi:MAG: YceI family protein [Chitinophagales bacterium]
MKQLMTYLGMILFVAVMATSCKQAPKADKVEAEAPKKVAAAATTAKTMAVDVAKSQVTWVGTKPVGQHNGTIGVKSGSVDVTDGTVTGGKFVLDITSLKATDMDEEGNGKLTDHLLADDFFDAEKFPEASFEITGVAPYTEPADSTKKALLAGATHNITGNLTLKGVSKSITFPAKVNAGGAGVLANANFNIDRTQWGMNYGNDKSLKDRFIRPEVNIGLNLVAN